LATLNLSDGDIRELLVILNVALLDAHIDDAQRETIRAWIHRFSQFGLTEQESQEALHVNKIDSFTVKQAAPHEVRLERKEQGGSEVPPNDWRAFQG
jgi:hypothetical protein